MGTTEIALTSARTAQHYTTTTTTTATTQTTRKGSTSATATTTSEYRPESSTGWHRKGEDEQEEPPLRKSCSSQFSSSYEDQSSIRRTQCGTTRRASLPHSRRSTGPEITGTTTSKKLQPLLLWMRSSPPLPVPTTSPAPTAAPARLPATATTMNTGSTNAPQSSTATAAITKSSSKIRHRSVSDGIAIPATAYNGEKTPQLPAVEEEFPLLAPPSPGTPPKKMWERHYRSFLTRRALLGKGNNSTKNNCNKGGSEGRLHELDVPAPIGKLRTQKSLGALNYGHSSFTRDSLKQSTTTNHSHEVTETRESSVRGGKFFANVFRQNHHHHPTEKPKRRAKSFSHTDELDGTLRRGVEKAHNPSRSHLFLQQRVGSLDDHLSTGAVRSIHHVTEDFYVDSALPQSSSGSNSLPDVAPSNGDSPPKSLSTKGETTELDSSSSSAMKKAFTEFHNSSTTGRDAVSAFLGDDPSHSGNSMAWSQRNQLAFTSNRIPTIASHGNLARMDKTFLLRTETTIATDAMSVVSNLRVLKPIIGVDSWQADRRYLIGPAVFAACPAKVHQKILGSNTPIPADVAALSWNSVFECILLGECLLMSRSQLTPSPTQQWSSAILMIRQNYLLEYDTESNVLDTPRGYANLEYAKCTLHPHFPDALQLAFFGSPCAKSDERILMIRIGKNKGEEREYWTTCLNRASSLCLNTMYHYDTEEPLGKGSYSFVYSGSRRQHENEGNYSLPANHSKALKVFDKARFWRHVVKGRERSDTIVREASVQITLTVMCAHISSFVKISGYLETSEHVVLELELLNGRDLFNHISSNSALREADAALILRDILLSLDAMNRIGVAHRDIKPANVLMSHRSDGATVKVGDFGMATFVGVDGQVRGRCGTPGYVAPEIFTAGVYGGYGNKVDVFSAGVTLYVMLCGYEPFYGESDAELVAANKSAKIEFPDEEWQTISSLARDLVLKMMHPDPNERLDAKHALQHPWILLHEVAKDEDPRKDAQSPDEFSHVSCSIS